MKEEGKEFPENFNAFLLVGVVSGVEVLARVGIGACIFRPALDLSALSQSQNASSNPQSILQLRRDSSSPPVVIL